MTQLDLGSSMRANGFRPNSGFQTPRSVSQLVDRVELLVNAVSRLGRSWREHARPLPSPLQKGSRDSSLLLRIAPHRWKLSFWIVLSVVALTTAGCGTSSPSAAPSHSKTILGKIRLFAPGDCSILFPDMAARFSYTAVNLLLENGSGEVIATSGLSSGTRTASDTRYCDYPFSIPDVPEVAIYTLNFSNYPQLTTTQSLRTLQDANWVWKFG